MSKVLFAPQGNPRGRPRNGKLSVNNATEPTVQSNAGPVSTSGHVRPANLFAAALDWDRLPDKAVLAKLGITSDGSSYVVRGYGRIPFPAPNHDFRRESLGSYLRDKFAVEVPAKRVARPSTRPVVVSYPEVVFDLWEDLVVSSPKIQHGHAVRSSQRANLVGSMVASVDTVTPSVTETAVVSIVNSHSDLEETAMKYIERFGDPGRQSNSICPPISVMDVGASSGGIGRQVLRFSDPAKYPHIGQVNCLCPIMSNSDIINHSHIVKIDYNGTKWDTYATRVFGCEHRLADCDCYDRSQRSVYFSRHSIYYWNAYDFDAIPVGSRVMVIASVFIGNAGVIRGMSWERQADGEILSWPTNGLGVSYRHKDVTNELKAGKFSWTIDGVTKSLVGKAIAREGDIFLYEFICTNRQFESIVRTPVREADPSVSLARSVPDALPVVSSTPTPPKVDRNSYEASIERQARTIHPDMTRIQRSDAFRKAIGSVAQMHPGCGEEKYTEDLERCVSKQHKIASEIEKSQWSNEAERFGYRLAKEGKKLPSYPWLNGKITSAITTAVAAVGAYVAIEHERPSAGILVAPFVFASVFNVVTRFAPLTRSQKSWHAMKSSYDTVDPLVG